MSAIMVPSLVWSLSLLPKKMTEVPMIATRFTTLHTPCATGVTRESVLKANCRGGADLQRVQAGQRQVHKW